MLGFGLGLTSGAGRSPGGPQTFVFAMLGQSNMIGRAAYDGGSLHPAGVQQWGRMGADNGRLVPASAPLQHHNPFPGQMGLDITFSQAFASAYPKTKLVLVPAAHGGTGFSTNRWNPGNDLYEDAVARVNAVMAANPGFRFAGFIWHQGENDVGFAGYEAALDTMITGLRQDVQAADATTPFILGGVSPVWRSGNTAREAIHSVIEATPNRLPRTGVASSDGLTSTGNYLHFNATDLHTLGTLYFSTWQSVHASLAPPIAMGQVPGQIDALTPPGNLQLQAPLALGQIPAQTNQIGLTPPEATGQIPDQEDIQA